MLSRAGLEIPQGIAVLLLDPGGWGWAPSSHAAPARLGEPSPVPGHVEGGGQLELSCEQCLISVFCLSFVRLLLGA